MSSFPLSKSSSVGVFFEPDNKISRVVDYSGQLTLTRTYSSPDLSLNRFDYYAKPSLYPYYYKPSEHRYLNDPWYYYNAYDDYWYNKYRYWRSYVHNDYAPYSYPYRDYSYSYWYRYKPRFYDYSYPYSYSSYVNPSYARPYSFYNRDLYTTYRYYRPLAYYSKVGSIPDRLI